MLRPGLGLGTLRHPLLRARGLEIALTQKEEIEEEVLDDEDEKQPMNAVFDLFVYFFVVLSSIYIFIYSVMHLLSKHNVLVFE